MKLINTVKLHPFKGRVARQTLGPRMMDNMMLVAPSRYASDPEERSIGRRLHGGGGYGREELQQLEPNVRTEGSKAFALRGTNPSWPAVGRTSTRWSCQPWA